MPRNPGLSDGIPLGFCVVTHRKLINPAIPAKRLAADKLRDLNPYMDKPDETNQKAENQVKVRKERHYRPHVEFYHAVWVHLEHVKDQHDGHFYSRLSALMLGAFTLEAYLNYVGPVVEPGWDDFDKASTMAKLRHIASVLRIEIDASRRPVQTIIALFSFRNRMAHPRADRVVEEYMSTQDDYLENFYSEPRPKWFAFATEENARRCYEDIGILIKQINASLPKPELLPLSDSGWSGSAGPP